MDTGVRNDFALDQLFSLPEKHKLYYHFDFGDDWYFTITIRKLRRAEKSPEQGIHYPRIIDQKGADAPSRADRQSERRSHEFNAVPERGVVAS